MKRLYYCPACGASTITDGTLYSGKETLINTRYDAIGPILHYECECGNRLAGCVDVTDMSSEGICYAMDVIEQFQKEATTLPFDA